MNLVKGIFDIGLLVFLFQSAWLQQFDQGIVLMS